MLLNPAPHDGDFGAAPPVQPVQSQTEQALDRWGNVLWSKQYDYVAVGQNPTLRRTYNNAYLATTPYTARYIFNRLVSTTLTDATTGQDKISHPQVAAGQLRLPLDKYLSWRSPAASRCLDT